jgi:tripartite-type tricarboxylate transporter receptor subunit TctC
MGLTAIRSYLLLVVLLLANGAALAQGYPNKPVKIVVPYPPGGTTDIFGRLIAQALQSRMAQPFIVENRAGAAGNIGADAVAKSPPDGYTLLMVPSNLLAINPWLYKKLPFDSATAFTPVGNIATLPNVIVVHANNRLGIRTFADLITAAKKQPPGSMSFGSPGNGSLLHLVGTVMAKVANAKMTHVPYKGAAPMLQGIYGNEVDVAIDNIPSVMPHLRGQRLRALMVTGAQRSPQLPDVPTAAELGYAALQLTSWFGLVAPAGTDPQVIAALNKQLGAVIQDRAVRDQIVSLGAQPAPGTAAEFGALIKAETARWGAIVKESGASID